MIAGPGNATVPQPVNPPGLHLAYTFRGNTFRVTTLVRRAYRRDFETINEDAVVDGA